MLEKFNLEKPNINNEYLLDYIKKINNNDLKELIYKSNNPQYLYWTELKYKSWIKDKIKPEEFWSILTFFRSLNTKTIYNFKTEEGKDLNLNMLERFSICLDDFKNFSINSYRNNDFFIINNLIEEAIASSQLEGAHTTREEAKKIIKQYKNNSRSWLINLNPHQQMIINNFKAMQILIDKYKYQNLSIDIILELHAIITENDKQINENKRGCFRSDQDNVKISNNIQYTHKAPNIDYVKKELDKLINFTNDKSDNLDVIIKAIIVHFMIGYLHPFIDGNGRLARCLFYWFLLKNKYDFMIFFPISRVLKLAPTQYSNAYIFAENMDFDLTYFIDFNIRKIQQAKKDFEEYYEDKIKELNDKQNNLKNIILKNNLNMRQNKYLQLLFNKKYEYLTIKYCLKLFHITRQTASKDLKELQDKNILKSIKNGKNIEYYLL